jgi:hypothetical protein
LLFNLTLVRCVVLLVEIVTVPGGSVGDGPDFRKIFFRLPLSVHAEDVRQFNLLLVAACIFLILPTLAYLARRAAGFSSRLQPTRLLVAIVLIGLVTEVLARLELV